MTLLPLRMAERLIDLCVYGLLVMSCATALFIALFGTLDVAATYFFGHPIPLARELPEELLVIVIFMAMPQAMRDDRNVAVDLFMERASPAVQRTARVLVLILCAAIFAFLAWQSFELALDSYSVRETVPAVYRFPIWPIKFLMSFAMMVTAIEAARLLARVLHDGRLAAPPVAQPLNTGF